MNALFTITPFVLAISAAEPLRAKPTSTFADWQFWVVTLAVVIAAGYMLRNVLPVPFFSSRAKRKKTEHKATLTVQGKSVDQ